MKVYTLPQSMYSIDSIKQILSYEDNCILYKQLSYDIIDAEALMVSHVIVYVVNGKAQINKFNGDEIILNNGEMLFLPRDSYVISDYLTNAKNLEVYLLFFDHTIVMKFLETQQKTYPLTDNVCRLQTSDNILLFFENISKMKFSNCHDKVLLEVKLLEFFHLITHKDKELFISTLLASEQHKQKRDILTLMNEHYDKNLSVADFAALSGRSLSTFNRIFKQKFHTTPKQWLIEKKIQKAYTLLKDGSSVTDVAFEVGYHNVSHFIKAYKSVYHQTPKEMQKLL